MGWTAGRGFLIKTRHRRWLPHTTGGETDCRGAFSSGDAKSPGSLRRKDTPARKLAAAWKKWLRREGLQRTDGHTLLGPKSRHFPVKSKTAFMYTVCMTWRYEPKAKNASRFESGFIFTTDTLNRPFTPMVKRNPRIGTGRRNWAESGKQSAEYRKRLNPPAGRAWVPQTGQRPPVKLVQGAAGWLRWYWPRAGRLLPGWYYQTLYDWPFLWKAAMERWRERAAALRQRHKVCTSQISAAGKTTLIYPDLRRTGRTGMEPDGS